MLLLQSFVERLRPLVGSESWDYIVIWKLSDDQRCIEYMCCCCAGSERGYNNGEQGLVSFPPSSSALPCRDFMFPHHRMGVCDLLDQLPTSVALDSGIHADAVLSNQVTWLKCSQNSDSSSSQEMISTRVLIPLSLGLIEMFVNKQVPEDQQVLNLIMAESNFFLEQQKMTSNSDSLSTDPHVTFHHQISPEITKQNMDLPQDISIGRIHLRSPTNLNNNAFETEHKNRGIFTEEGTLYELGLFAPSFQDGFHEAEGAQSHSSSKLMQDQMNDDSFLCENYKSDHSDPIDDEDEIKHRRRSAKGPSKNLKAERNRRKKLNERLYALRSLVPNISKLDRASILGDAIKYVRELQEQEKELQMELEENSDDEDVRKTGKNTTPNAVQTSNNQGLKRGQENLMNGFHKNYNANIDKQNHEAELIYDKVQQMEPQVEVFQLDVNEFFIKVFCEHRSGGFERLMQALNTLGLEVTNANSSRHTCLVSSSFIVEQKNQDSVQADMVKESLLELTRNPSRIWSNATDELQNGEPVDEDDNFVDHEFSENSLFPTLQPNPMHGLQNSVYN